MYSVMIVDDEPAMRERLRNLVDWASFGFVVSDTAVSGPDALRKCEQRMPDVMIVDIRMPRMSGLELIERIRAQNRRVRFLILGGYGDIGHARKAIPHKTDGCLLKPVDEEELAGYLKKLKDILDRQRAGKHDDAGERSPEQWAHAILLEESRAKRQSLLKAAEGFGFGWPPCEAVLVRPLVAGPIPPVHFSNVRTQVDRLMKDSKRGITVALYPHVLLLVRGVGNDAERAALWHMIEPVFRQHGWPFAAVSGGAVTGLAELPDVWNRTMELMDMYRFFLESDRIYTESAVYARMEELTRVPMEADGDGTDQGIINRLHMATDVGHEPLIGETVRAAGAAMIRAGHDEEGIKAGFSRLITSVFHKFVRQDAGLKRDIDALSGRLADLRRETVYAAFLDRVVALLMELSARIDAVSGNEKRIRKMIAFIHRNYAEPLKLETLAGLFNYNSAYLGKLFRQTTGDYFNTYLDRVRIEQAKRLLKQGEKVYCVAEKVGYANVDYFYGKFRKYVGMAPTDYKKMAGQPGRAKRP